MYESTAIATLDPRPVLIVHDWGRSLYRGKSFHGRYYFVSGDNRFWCILASCAVSWVPSQTWAVRSGRLVNVTRSVPAFARADAKRAWHWYVGPHGRRSQDDHGVGIFAGWCGDEYIVGRGAVCQRVLRQELAAGHLHGYGVSGKRFARQLNRDLERWGYKHSRRVVKHAGAFTATLTYTTRPKAWLSPVSNVTLRIEREGHLVFRRKSASRTCSRPIDVTRGACTARHSRFSRWGPRTSRHSSSASGPAATRAARPTLLRSPGRGSSGSRTPSRSLGPGSCERITGRSSSAATVASTALSRSVQAESRHFRSWTIDAANRFVDVTQSFPGLIRAHARRLATGGGPRRTIRDQGSGALAAWCGDEYLLGQGPRCSRAVTYAMSRHWPKAMQGAIPGHGFLRSLNRDLVRWGYKHRR